MKREVIYRNEFNLPQISLMMAEKKSAVFCEICGK